jgi:L-ribulose-5-phosphate 4-epimerase
MNAIASSHDLYQGAHELRARPDELLPKLTPEQEMVVLARTLWQEGYDDHLAGHITYRQHDGTLLCTPWLLTWEELLPSDVIRIDLEGNRLAGDWPVPLGIPLHLELHRQRSDVVVAVHHHPLFGTLWANRLEVPPCLDQSSALGGGDLVLVDEYRGPVNDPQSAARAVEQMGNAAMALLANHGVFVTASTIRAAHQRAVALERRCKMAWLALAIGPDVRELPEPARSFFARSDGNGFVGFFEAMARRELRRDPRILEV